MTRAQKMLAGLGTVALLLTALLIAQKFGFGDGFRLAPVAVDKREKLPSLPAARSSTALKPLASYEAMLERPVFNEDRKPTPIEETSTEAAPASVAALDAQLTGVILMPKLSLAMIRENATGKAMRVRLGKELDGALAGWKLIELEPRKAVFEAEGQGRQELDLAIDSAGAPAQSPPAMVNNGNAQNPMMGRATPAPPPNAGAAPPNVPPPLPHQVAQASGAGAAKVEPAEGSAVEPEQPEVAESIRRRIEERRRQLREEAARMMQQPQQ